MGSPDNMLVALSASLLSLLSLLSSSSALTAICTFKGDGVGQLTGDILLTEHETPDGTAIEIAGEVMNLSPGEHGFHIHEAGDLSDDCKGAGGNTPYGSEDPSWLPSPPSNRCGSPSKNTTNA